MVHWPLVAVRSSRSRRRPSNADGSITASGDIDRHLQVSEFIETNNGPITATTVINVP